ncbi:unnamed protein product [Adineta steineri]|uniref:Uncharacterized protein n=1 Tax=Adineta steineri TaxID=433720 RepID=A0A815DUD8_9BILA|nr:unnamed protein product [Adineta steineri]CAF1302222.1 unnamed protein product [Adineta steineri]CAF1576101.1 unnamed protein product [Adineta steineri]CAF1576301.1 unnamed protein product [Adineta steineri]
MDLFMKNIAGDCLHGSHRYALYESYGLSCSNIQFIYIVSYTSSLVIGTFAASLADLYGRRLGCLLSNVVFILMSILMRFLDDTLLKRILRDANIGLSFISIGAGVSAQFLVKQSNYAKFWSENYGNKDAKAT